MRIHWWSAEEEGGCRFYRQHLPSTALEFFGHRSTIGQILIPYTDVVFGQRVVFDKPSTMWRNLKIQGKKLVWDADDDYFNIDPTNGPGYKIFQDPAVRQNIEANASIADVVTVASEGLVDTYRRFNDNVIVVPNGLPASWLNYQHPRDEHDRLTIGWAGSDSTIAELHLVKPALVKMFDKRTKPKDVRIHTVGIQHDTVMKEIGRVMADIDTTTWVLGTEQYLKRIDFDIWLAPYRPTTFNRAKFPTKALEAAFLGIPIIASDIEPYRNFVRHGETGFLVKQDYQWERYIRTLIEDEKLRTAMGEAARVQATEHVMEGYALLWNNVIEGAVK